MAKEKEPAAPKQGMRRINAIGQEDWLRKMRADAEGTPFKGKLEPAFDEGLAPPKNCPICSDPLEGKELEEVPGGYSARCSNCGWSGEVTHDAQSGKPMRAAAPKKPGRASLD